MMQIGNNYKNIFKKFCFTTKLEFLQSFYTTKILSYTVCKYVQVYLKYAVWDTGVVQLLKLMSNHIAS